MERKELTKTFMMILKKKYCSLGFHKHISLLEGLIYILIMYTLGSPRSQRVHTVLISQNGTDFSSVAGLR